MRDRPDLYVVLGVEPSATLAEIQAAFRQRVQVIHPDRFDRARMPRAWAHANSMLQELNEAYRTLSDPRLRRDYDRLHSKPQNAAPNPTPPAATRSPAPPPRTRNHRKSNLGRFAVLTGIGALILWAVLADKTEQRDADAFFLSPSSAPTPRAQAPVDLTELARSAGAEPVDGSAVEPTGRFSLADIDPPGPVGCEPDVSASSLPANGAIWRYDAAMPVAPLEIRVKGADQYLVKLERNGESVAAMLIRASSTAEMQLPLGNYILKYAAGSGEYWCGEGARFPFGRQTTFHKADEIFSFRRESDHYSGYTIELFLQSNGNLSTSALSPQAW